MVANNLLEVRRQRATIYLSRAAVVADALVDLDDDARETVLVDVDFLVVGYLTQLAVVEDTRPMLVTSPWMQE